MSPQDLPPAQTPPTPLFLEKTFNFLSGLNTVTWGICILVIQTSHTPEPFSLTPTPYDHQPWEVVAFTSKTNPSVGMFSVALCASALDSFKLQQGASYGWTWR